MSVEERGVLAGAASTEAERRAGRILAEIGDPLVVVDRDFRIVDVNAAAERALGTPRDVLVGQSHWEAFPGSVGAEPERAYRRVATEHVDAHFTYHYVDAGRDFHAEIDAYPTDEGGVAIFWRDVSARVRAEAGLRASEARYRTLFESIDEGFCVIEVLFDDEGRAVDYRFLEANPAFVRQTGLADGIGRRMRELAPAHEPHWFEIYGRVATTGEPVRFQHAAEALHRYYDVFAFRIGDPEDRQVAVLFTDIRAVKMAEDERARLFAAERAARAAAEAERRRLALILDRLPVGVVVVDATGAVVHVNPACDEVLGTSLAPVAGLDDYPAYGGALHADGRPYSAGEYPIARAATAGEVVHQELTQYRRGDGEVVTLSLSAAPVRDAATGAIEYAVATIEDVNEREAARAEAETARQDAERAAERLARLHRVTVALASAVTPDALAAAVVREGAPAVGARVGVVTRLSDDGRELRVVAAHGLPEDAATTWAGFSNRSPSPHADTLATRTPLFITSPEEYERRYPHLRSLREAAATSATAALPLIVGGEPFGVLSFGFDTPREFSAEDREFLVTVASQCAQALERARLFEAESAARREAEAASRAKGEFLAVMSHELRTPLNAIGGYVELIELGIHGPVTPQQRTALDRIQRSQRALLARINEVLNYARLETGAVTYDVGDVPVIEAVGAAEVLVAPQLRAKGLAYSGVACDPGLVVRADRDKLQQILLNLLSNAIKFTDGRDGRPGCVEVSCACDADAVVSIRVRDTGIGIPSDKLAAVFEPFVQVDARLTRPHEGTGLGLAISRDLARGMGGDLTAESTAGQGSTFTLTLPRA